MDKVGAIIVAAGKGTRMNLDINKVYYKLNGQTVLEHSVVAFADSGLIDEIIVVASENEIHIAEPIAEKYSAKAVIGGELRRDSVLNGLYALSDSIAIAAIHDAARPMVSYEVIKRSIDSASFYGSGVAGVAVKDTIKIIDESGIVQDTLRRDALMSIQTPQTFNKDLLIKAYREIKDRDVTDDASVFERFGQNVHITEGSYRNIKITTPEDLLIIKALLGADDMNIRIGTGFDAHQLITGRPLVLGGVEIPHSHGLDGHSDADVLVHAVMDALLGAVGLGDIGMHFPDTDQRYKGVSSLLLLKEVSEKLSAKGYSIQNIDSTIIAQAPKLSQYINDMRENIAEILAIETERINIKATTTEHMGFTGRKEGIAAQAVASVARL